MKYEVRSFEFKPEQTQAKHTKSFGFIAMKPLPNFQINFQLLYKLQPALH